MDLFHSLEPLILLNFSLYYHVQERKKGCVFLPGDAISLPLPFSKNPWVESVVTRITDLGDKNVDKSQGGAACEGGIWIEHV
ncbi:unnamed protein product [Ilex paraguariensis]|uniref:Uncharacterized protein n=1 Tax=Ilex paraguariensis TaxID=185542 RepID=A0ABC8UDY2_9AQUA